MIKRLPTGRAAATAAVVVGVLTAGAAGASANPIKLPTLTQQYHQQTQYFRAHEPSYLTPPPVPCPENGLLPSTPVTGACGITELPATGLPLMGNMAYYGGAVQTHPKIYLVYWGWGEPGAFPGQACTPETITEGTASTTLACDPDGAGKYAADFAAQAGGTSWAKTQDQYYMTSSGQPQNIDESGNLLGGLWADDTHDITGLAKTTGNATYHDIADEAALAVQHFESTGELSPSDLANADIMVLQPPAYSDPNALASGYCAFHDWVAPNFEGGVYNGLPVENFAYSNIPYQLAINSGGVNVCGENAVNSGAAGKLDGFSIVLGHEAEETITDPGAEDVSGSGLSAKYLGGWYDTIDADENGDKCAWVGENPLTAQGPPLPIPGAMGDIKGSGGGTFAVQALWSNDSAAGAGYCAGAGTDLGF
jgi:serine protease